MLMHRLPLYIHILLVSIANSVSGSFKPSLPTSGNFTSRTMKGKETRVDPIPSPQTGQPSLHSNSSLCYGSWLQYWSSSRASEQMLNVTLIPASNLTRTQTFTRSSQSLEITTIVSVDDQTFTRVDGGFTVGTETVESRTTETATLTAQNATSILYTNTFIEYTTSWAGSMPSRPTCQLPLIVSGCQSMWESWASTQLMPPPAPAPGCDIYGAYGRTGAPWACANSFLSTQQSYLSSVASYPPVCQAASIGGGLCQSIRDYFVGNMGYFEPEGFRSHFNFPGGGDALHPENFNTTAFWPTKSTLGAPSCTLGCGRCAVTGGTVQLLYWPPTSTAGNVKAHVSAALAAAVPSPVTLVTLGTTLTSPTLYISYKHVYASDGCSDMGPTLSSTIMAIPTSSMLSSVYAYTPPCRGMENNTHIWTNTAPFTVADLNSPVPFSIYSSQPWCATYEQEHGCLPGCPTNAPYNPILVVPNAVLESMNPAWSTCYGDIRGFYDPPAALYPASSAAAVTTAAYASSTQTATPAYSPSQPAPQTLQPQDPSYGVLTTSQPTETLTHPLPSLSDTITTSDDALISATSTDPMDSGLASYATTTITAQGVDPFGLVSFASNSVTSAVPESPGLHAFTSSTDAPAALDSGLVTSASATTDATDGLTHSIDSGSDGVQLSTSGDPQPSQPIRPPSGPAIEGLISAIASAIQPTNALQVLSQAESPVGTNPTAAAIMSLIGGAHLVSQTGIGPATTLESDTEALAGDTPVPLSSDWPIVLGTPSVSDGAQGSITVESIYDPNTNSPSLTTSTQDVATSSRAPPELVIGSQTFVVVGETPHISTPPGTNGPVTIGLPPNSALAMLSGQLAIESDTWAITIGTRVYAVALSPAGASVARTGPSELSGTTTFGNDATFTAVPDDIILESGQTTLTLRLQQQSSVAADGQSETALFGESSLPVIGTESQSISSQIGSSKLIADPGSTTSSRSVVTSTTEGAPSTVVTATSSAARQKSNRKSLLMILLVALEIWEWL